MRTQRREKREEKKREIKREKERERKRERKRNRERQRRGEHSVATPRIHLAQTYQSFYRVLGKHCNLGLSMPWSLNYQWPTTHPFSSVKESPHQRQYVFNVTRDVNPNC